ncbi:MAG: discoidin domain-containing protein [Kiritimatiellia bacterium]
MRTIYRRRLFLITLLLAAAAALAFRIAFYAFGLHHVPFSTDEAWPALMGLNVLKGSFPVFYWGQNYMGAQQAYFDAAVFLLLGATALAARIYPLFFSILYVAASGLLARRIYGRRAALVTVILLAAPVPYLAMAGALSVPPEYLPLTAMGTLALWLLAGAAIKPSPKIAISEWRVFLALGLLLGFMFWLHIVAASYVVTAILFIFLRDRLFFLRGPFWLAAAAFALGGLPFWLFNLTHGFATFADMAGNCPWQRSLELCKAFFGMTLHFMAGTKIMLYGDSVHYLSLPSFAGLALGTLLCALAAVAVLTRLRGMLRWLRPRPFMGDGTAILLVLALCVIFLFCRSERSAWHNARFALPLMSALPLLFACGLTKVWKWNRYLFAILLIFIIGAQAWGNFLLCRAWGNPDTVGRTLDLPDTGPLHSFLGERGITRAYAHYWISYRITFEARERLVCAEPFNERFPGRPAQYLEEVHAATNIAFITHPILSFIPDIEKQLKMIGGSYRKSAVGDFTVYHGFVPPYKKGGDPAGITKLRELERARWRLSSSLGSNTLEKARDGAPATGWTTGAPQQGGQWIEIDLGGLETICKIRFDTPGVECDAPNGYRVEASSDGMEWHAVYETGPVAAGFFWENDQPWMYVGNSFYTAAFAPLNARRIRVTLTMGHPRFWWTIRELRVFGPG